MPPARGAGGTARRAGCCAFTPCTTCRLLVPVPRLRPALSVTCKGGRVAGPPRGVCPRVIRAPRVQCLQAIPLGVNWPVNRWAVAFAIGTTCRSLRWGRGSFQGTGLRVVRAAILL